MSMTEAEMKHLILLRGAVLDLLSLLHGDPRVPPELLGSPAAQTLARVLRSERPTLAMTVNHLPRKEGEVSRILDLFQRTLQGIDDANIDEFGYPSDLAVSRVVDQARKKLKEFQ